MDLGKIKTGVKKFFSNPNTLTFILVIALIVVIYLVYSYMIGRAIAPVSIPYCTNELKSSNEITGDSIGSIEVSGNFVTANGSSLLQNQRQIRNQYVARGYMIPKNSFFYRDAVTDSASAEQSVREQLSGDNTYFEVPVDFHSTYGCSIMPGNYIDLYAMFNDPENDNKLVYTWFIKSIQVAYVYNAKGQDVFTEADDGKCNPSTLVFIVSRLEEEQLIKSQHMSFKFKIVPVPRNAGYTDNPEPSQTNESLSQLIELNSSIME